MKFNKQIIQWNFKHTTIYKIKKKIKFNKTALYLAIEKENIDIVKLLLSNDKTDPNIRYVFFYFKQLWHSKKTQLNYIQ